MRVRRDDVMYNDFVIVGPAADPAGVAKAATAKDAFRGIHAAAATVREPRRQVRHAHQRTGALEVGRSRAGRGRRVVPLGRPGHGRNADVRERAEGLCADGPRDVDVDAGAPSQPAAGLRRRVGGGEPRPRSSQPVRRHRHRQRAACRREHGAGDSGSPIGCLSKPTQQRIGAFGRDAAGHSLFYPDSDQFKATDQVRVVIGARSRTFTLDELRKARRATLDGVEYIGVKKGALGNYTLDGRIAERPPALRSTPASRRPRARLDHRSHQQRRLGGHADLAGDVRADQPRRGAVPGEGMQ